MKSIDITYILFEAVLQGRVHVFCLKIQLWVYIGWYCKHLLRINTCYTIMHVIQ